MVSEIDIYKGVKTVFNRRISIAPWTDTYKPDAELDVDGQSNLIAREDFKVLARCKQATDDVATEDDPEDAFDEKTLTRVKTQNTMVSTRTSTFDMERQTLLYLAIYSGVKDPMSEETLALIASGKGVPTNATNNPKVPVAFKDETYDDKQNLLFTQYSYGYLVATGSRTSDGKISRPQIQYEMESSKHTQTVYSEYFLSLLAPAV